MDLESTLFGLSTFVHSCLEKNLDATTVYKDSYVQLLDQLAVLLRDPQTRDDKLIKDNLLKLVDCADFLLQHPSDAGYRELLAELIRVLANGIADNDENRNIVSGNSQFIERIGISINECKDSEINTKLIILLKNLVLDNSQAASRVSVISPKILEFIESSNDKYIVVDLLADVLKYEAYKPKASYILSIIDLLDDLLNNQNSSLSFEDEDEFAEIANNTAQVLEQLTSNPAYDFSNETVELELQKKQFDLLEKLFNKEFPNKLSVQRRVFASIGNVSSNITCRNRTSEYSLPRISDQKEENGYILSSSMLVVGNSITSSSDRDSLLEKSPNLISNVLDKYQFLVDPVLFQGILHLLKMVINLDTANSLFEEVHYKKFELLIEATVRNSRYYSNFTPLLNAVLKKIVVLMNKEQFKKVLNSDLLEILNSLEENYDSNLIIFLILNKLAIYGFKDCEYYSKFVSRVFKFNNNNLSLNYLFELTKTIGVLIQCDSELMLNADFSDGLLTLLTAVDSINSNDNASKAVLNNAKYISGTITNAQKTQDIKQDEINPQLLEISIKVLRK